MVHRFRNLIAVVGIVAVVGVVWIVRSIWFPPIASWEQQAWHAFQAADFKEAASRARLILKHKPASSIALVISGRIAEKRKAYRSALAYYARIDDETSLQSRDGLCRAGRLALQMFGRATEAEGYFRRVLHHSPDDACSTAQLGALLAAEGRRLESVPYLLTALRQGPVTKKSLLMLGQPNTEIFDQALIVRCRNAVPDDPLPLMALARVALYRNKVAYGRQLLRQIVAVRPRLAEAQALLGRALMEADSPDDFLAWRSHLPDAALSHTDIWVVRGQWAEKHRDLRGAVRAYWEAVERNPNRASVLYALAKNLNALDEPGQARPFLDRARRTREYQDSLKNISSGQEGWAIKFQAGQQAEALGLMQEASAWYRLAAQDNPNHVETREKIAQCAERAQAAGASRTLSSANPAAVVDLSGYLLPRWKYPEPQRSKSRASPEAATVRFDNVSSQAGIQFRYYNSPDPQRGMVRNLETVGGGVAVLDFDNDGWPDLYFPQGCPWPILPGNRKYRDRLYRNRGDGHFDDVTKQSCLGDEGFSHGATIGDFNNDGFPDVYVANIGGNRLYRNNGDGTFSDVTAECGLRGTRWTTSCLLADLNGDSWPDIYDVNYLRGREALEAVCQGAGGIKRNCGVHRFPAAQDQLYLNLGNGRFRDVSDTAGIRIPGGKGLGIVAADLDGSGQLDLFIANDTTPNFLFVNQTKRSESPLVFSEQAYVTGLACDFRGRSQACMGVAAGDADGNGLLDLFVTNFYNDSNTLYLQRKRGLYEDATRQAGLNKPGIDRLAWGTQFLDSELDGWPDIILVNGHVENLSDYGVPFRMTPQYFRNTGEGRFQEVSSKSLGSYFGGKYLGRGVARLDWNRDGRDDIAVSQIGDGAALLTNQSAPVGHFLAVELRGVRGSRDAIGAVVTVTVGRHAWTRELTAGDGFLASNQRRLTFGLGANAKIGRLTIRWPSGYSQSWSQLEVDREWLFVEGRMSPVSFPARG